MHVHNRLVAHMNAFARLLVAMALSCLSSAGLAQSPISLLHPSAVTLPKLPGPSANVSIRITDQTGVGAEVEQKSVEWIGNTLEIRAGIKMGYADVMGSYTILESLGTLSPGIYTLRYVAKARRFDQPYDEETKSWTWRFVVIESTKSSAAIEYYHADFNHYFLTVDEAEISALDAGLFSGWARTGQTIRVIVPAGEVAGDAPVCRFYGRPEAGLNTHVYTANATECSILSTQPEVWIWERADAFEVAPVDVGGCPIDWLPVFRVWNGLAAANHRYTTSISIQSEMVDNGWIPEGSGSPPSIWCALPPAISP